MNLFESDHSAQPNFNEDSDTDPTIHFSENMPSSMETTHHAQAAPLFNPPHPMPSAQTTQQETTTYSIEHVIRILRASPIENQEQAISLILSTLESTGINTQSLLNDVSLKEEQAHTAIQKLEKEIDFLNTQIQERQQQMNTFTDLMTEFRLIKNKILQQKT